MIEIRFHGRGGQGAVTSAELLALAAIGEGKYAQAMPSFGPERRGAPVAAYARVDDEFIRLRVGIKEPYVVVVLDPSLLSLPAITQGLRDGGTVVANFPGSVEDARTAMGGYRGRLAVVDATSLAMKHLGRPITNTAMLGAFARATSAVQIGSFEEPLKERFGKRGPANYECMKAAYEATTVCEGG